MASDFNYGQGYGDWHKYAGYTDKDTGDFSFGKRPSGKFAMPGSTQVSQTPVAPPSMMPKQDYSVVPINTTQYGIPFNSSGNSLPDPSSMLSPQNASLYKAFTSAGD